jgi:hypothetical protein
LAILPRRRRTEAEASARSNLSAAARRISRQALRQLPPGVSIVS